MPVKKLCEKTKRVCHTHKKPLILVLLVAVLTGVAERFGETLFFNKKEPKTPPATSFYINQIPPVKNQKVTCPFCHEDIYLNSITTHTATQTPKKTPIRQKE